MQSGFPLRKHDPNIYFGSTGPLPCGSNGVRPTNASSPAIELTYEVIQRSAGLGCYTFWVRKLIVNADDFGLTVGVNRGIVECNPRGLVSPPTLWPMGVVSEG